MTIDLPAHLVGSGTLDRLVNTARDYAAQSEGTRKPPALSMRWSNGCITGGSILG